LNRRSQACDVLAGTGIRVAKDGAGKVQGFNDVPAFHESTLGSIIDEHRNPQKRCFRVGWASEGKGTNRSEAPLFPRKIPREEWEKSLEIYGKGTKLGKRPTLFAGKKSNGKYQLLFPKGHSIKKHWSPN
jgi:hypothetical protein